MNSMELATDEGDNDDDIALEIVTSASPDDEEALPMLCGSQAERCLLPDHCELNGVELATDEEDDQLAGFLPMLCESDTQRCVGCFHFACSFFSFGGGKNRVMKPFFSRGLECEKLT